MRPPRGWPLLVVAAVAVGLAVYAGPNQVAGTAWALLAVFAVALLVFGPARRAAPTGQARFVRPPPEPASTFRLALRAGRSGRSEVVAQVDEVERKTIHPGLPTTGAVELERLGRLSRADFREYVRGRLDAIEEGYP